MQNQFSFNKKLNFPCVSDESGLKMSAKIEGNSDHWLNCSTLKLVWQNMVLSVYTLATHFKIATTWQCRLGGVEISQSHPKEARVPKTTSM